MALVGEPDLLLLDEPINGLDPQGIAEVRNTLLELNKKKDITIIISSHILEELSKVATNFGFINHGELVKELSHDELDTACNEHIQLKMPNPDRALPILDKFITISIYTVLMMITAMSATMLGSQLFFGYVSLAGMSQGIIFLLIQILLHMGYGMFVLLLYHITRSSVATMLSGILIAAGILQFVDAILLAVFEHLKSAVGFSILNYTTSGNVGVLPLSGEETVYMRAGTVAVCAILLLNILSSIIIQKRDL